MRIADIGTQSIFLDGAPLDHSLNICYKNNIAVSGICPLLTKTLRHNASFMVNFGTAVYLEHDSSNNEDFVVLAVIKMIILSR